jgi:hypothetical protein
MKQKWYRIEANGFAWMKVGVWKLRGIRRGLEKGICLLCMGNKDIKNIPLSYPETKKMEDAIYKQGMGLYK